VANPAHVKIVKEGTQAICEWREKYPDVRFDLRCEDLSGADLHLANLRGADLSRANLSGASLRVADLRVADLGGADLSKADLSGADLSRGSLRGADLRGADVGGAHLGGAHLREADLRGANLGGANLGGAILSRANLGEADLGGADLNRAVLREADLSKADFSGAELSGAHLGGTHLGGANLRGAILSRANLSGAHLRGADLSGADLSGADLNGADLSGADLSRARLSRANLSGATLRGSSIDRALFSEANVCNSDFHGVRNAAGARGLATVRIEKEDVRYFEACNRSRLDKLVDWERLRLFGRLPLFGASYAILICIALFMYSLAFYNSQLERLRSLARTISERIDEPETALEVAVVTTAEWVSGLEAQPVPSLSFSLLVSALLLAIASTIYAFFCPARIKEYSKDQWCDELRQPLIHYWPLSWTYRWVRLTCFAFYVIGVLGALWVLIAKICRAALHICQNSTFSFI
jgi:uncharacterized protein YjbI with pentapeptide repeats